LGRYPHGLPQAGPQAYVRKRSRWRALALRLGSTLTFALVVQFITEFSLDGLKPKLADRLGKRLFHSGPNDRRLAAARIASFHRASNDGPALLHLMQAGDEALTKPTRSESGSA